MVLGLLADLLRAAAQALRSWLGLLTDDELDREEARSRQQANPDDEPPNA